MPTIAESPTADTKATTGRRRASQGLRSQTAVHAATNHWKGKTICSAISEGKKNWRSIHGQRTALRQLSYEGAVAQMNTKALTSAAIAGLLRPMLQDINVVSAPVVAKDRGIVIEEITREAAGDYDSLITVTVTTEKQTRSVSGTVFADGRPRIVDIKGIRMDAEFGPSMIYITNLDKPGFIGRFSSTLGDAGINIATFHVGREAPGGNAIALIEIDGELPPDVLAKVRALPQVQQARPLKF